MSRIVNWIEERIQRAPSAPGYYWQQIRKIRKPDDRVQTAQTSVVSLNRPWETKFMEKSSEEDIYYCFRLILGRNPSQAEWPGHKSLAGKNLRDVVSTYLSSREFRDRKLGALSNTEHVLVDLDRYQMYVSTSDTAVGIHIHRQKTYEPHVTEAIKMKLGPGMYFVDIGANIGYFSLLAAYLVGKEGRVFSFEPFQYNVKLLYLNARINGFENIEIYPFALADKKSLFAYDNMASNGVISGIDDDVNSVLSTTLVYSIKLDDVLQNVERLDAIKIDVEGAEYMALSGARSLLKRHRPTIFAEFAPPALNVVSKVSAEAFLRLLLIDDSYSLAVLGSDGQVFDCKNDLSMVIGYFEAAGSDHIDIVASPLNQA